jgi:GT2 family glycosyltransferase
MENAGLAASLNFGASRASAPLLARLDADDIAYPERLATQVRLMAARPDLGLLGSTMDVINERGRSIGRIESPVGAAQLRTFLRTGCCFVQSSVMMRANVFDRAGRYREGLNISEDYDLWTRMAEVGECANLATVLGGYRVHRASLTSRYPARLTISSLCISAAVEARRQGRPEPFSAGIPNLRLALPLLGITHARSRRLVRVRTWRIAFGRALQALPLPGPVRVISHKLVSALKLRQLYASALRIAFGFSRTSGKRDLLETARG